jgi:hypothetical protein
MTTGSPRIDQPAPGCMPSRCATRADAWFSGAISEINRSTSVVRQACSTDARAASVA